MHKEYIRYIPGAKNAVLFIHGIVGTPNHFRDLMPLVSLVPDSWTIHNVLLPGHGGSVEDFGRSSMEIWRSHVQQVYRELAKEHERVLVVAHSMGTLFAVQLALDHPEKISSLFLLAMPMRPGLRWTGIENVFRVAFDKVRKDCPHEAATRDACGVTVTRKLWKYICWIPRFLELYWEIHETEKRMDKLNVPCIAWQSKKDELVTNHTRRVLERYPAIEIRDLNDSTHFYYTEVDRKAVIQAFEEICTKIEKQD